MKHNQITRNILGMIEDIETSLIITEPDFSNFRGMSETAPKQIKINWPLWM